MSHNPHPYKEPHTDWGVKPVVSNQSDEKRQFMLSYFIAAGQSGRFDGDRTSRNELADTASELYDLASELAEKLG